MLMRLYQILRKVSPGLNPWALTVQAPAFAGED